MLKDEVQLRGFGDKQSVKIPTLYTYKLNVLIIEHAMQF